MAHIDRHFFDFASFETFVGQRLASSNNSPRIDKVVAIFAELARLMNRAAQDVADEHGGNGVLVRRWWEKARHAELLGMQVASGRISGEVIDHLGSGAVRFAEFFSMAEIAYDQGLHARHSEILNRENHCVVV